MSLITIDASHYPEVRLAAEYITIVRGRSPQGYRITEAENLHILCMEPRLINFSFSAHETTQASVMSIHLADPVTLPTAFEFGSGIRVLANFFPFAIEAATTRRDQNNRRKQDNKGK